MNADAGEAAREPREPSFLDALAPVVVMIGLLVLTIVLFGVDAATGPLQVALFASAVFAGLIAMKNGHTSARLRNAMIGGVSSAMGAIFILLAVGALIGTWNMAGTIPTVVSYGIAVLKPSIFYAAVALICAVVGAVTGSSWTTAGTLGVAFIGMSYCCHAETCSCRSTGGVAAANWSRHVSRSSGSRWRRRGRC